MALNSEQIGKLLRKLQYTREAELTCPECLDELDRYVQKFLDGAPVEGLLEQVRQHLADCPCCQDQLQLVLETLEAIDEE